MFSCVGLASLVRTRVLEDARDELADLSKRVARIEAKFDSIEAKFDTGFSELKCLFSQRNEREQRELRLKAERRIETLETQLAKQNEQQNENAGRIDIAPM
ncbi:MAG: hypothetical protein MHM6MM_007229 [Cercozoa sp. M6MM]